MSERRTDGRPSHLRQRSTAALVLSRPDSRPGGSATTSSGGDRGAAGRRSRGLSRWLAVLTWIVLGAAIAALWALLLFGDSLVVSA